MIFEFPFRDTYCVSSHQVFGGSNDMKGRLDLVSNRHRSHDNSIRIDIWNVIDVRFLWTSNFCVTVVILHGFYTKEMADLTVLVHWENCVYNYTLTEQRRVCQNANHYFDIVSAVKWWCESWDAKKTWGINSEATAEKRMDPKTRALWLEGTFKKVYWNSEKKCRS